MRGRHAAIAGFDPVSPSASKAMLAGKHSKLLPRRARAVIFARGRTDGIMAPLSFETGSQARAASPAGRRAQPQWLERRAASDRLATAVADRGSIRSRNGLRKVWLRSDKIKRLPVLIIRIRNRLN